MESENGAPGSETQTEAEAVAEAQVKWLKGLLIQIGPTKVRVGVVYMTLAAFIEDGLREVEQIVKYNRNKQPLPGQVDDDIPF